MRRIVVTLATAWFAVQCALADPAGTSTGNAPSPPPPPATPAPKPAPTAAPVPQEDTANYVQGYSDGCASANLRYARQEHVKPNKDATLYDSDKDYHDGWNHGYRKCEDRITPGGLSVPGNSVVL